jgi:hypothetical protein
VALLVLFLLGILRMLLDIVTRAITIAKVCRCGWWLMGAFWGTLLQVAVAPMLWAVAKGHTLGKAVTYQMDACINVMELEDQRWDLERPTAARGPLNNLERLVNWSQDFLNRQQEDRVYPAPAGRDEQVALSDMNKDQVQITRPRTGSSSVILLIPPFPGSDLLMLSLMEVSKRGSSADEKGTREQRRDMIRGSMCECVTRSLPPLKDCKDSCKSSEADNNMQGGQLQQ